MSDILDLHLRKLIKVKVKKITNQTLQKRENYEILNLDPDTASYSYIRKLLAHVFHIDSEFTVSYRKDKVYVPLTSDCDLNAAISKASKPYLSLAIELQPTDQTLHEWDIICPVDISPLESEVTRCSEERKSLAGSILSQMENAMLKLQRALSFDYNIDDREKPSLDQLEFDNFLDSEGRIVSHHELHMSVYRGGVEPGLRPTVWQHLLNIFPHGLTSAQRDSYLNSKSEEYYRLRHRWQHLIQAGTVPEILQDITCLVRKDVRRTDRSEKFYSGPDENENVKALYNVLTTYAVNHPSVSYCQGMSDLLSPILYVMKKESLAYICFCGLMKRTNANFKLDGRSMKIKFRHLRKMIWFYDRELFAFLKEQASLDLLFCYRWLLLELKREFAYSDMLSMMEVLWGSLPPRPPQKDLDLYEVKFPSLTIYNSLRDKTRLEDMLTFSDEHFNESQYSSLSQSSVKNNTLQAIKNWAVRVRRESIARLIDSNESSSEEEIKLPLYYRKRKYRSYIACKLGRLNENAPTTELDIKSCKVSRRRDSVQPEICQSWSCGEIFEDRPQEINDALYDAREFLRNQWCYSNTVNEIQLNNWLNGRHIDVKDATAKDDDSVLSESNNRQRHSSSDSNYSTVSDEFSDNEDECQCRGEPTNVQNRRSRSEGYMSDTASSKALAADDDEYDTEEEDEDDDDLFEDGSMESADVQNSDETEKYIIRRKDLLPPPHALGDGNPFLLYVCVTMVLQHRDDILKQKLDFNELGIYFDKMVRKHKFSKLLLKAQKMFKEYLNMGWDVDSRDNFESPKF